MAEAQVIVVGETASEDTSSSGEEFEMRITPRSGSIAVAASASDDDTNSDDDTGSSHTASADDNKCAFCSSRKVKACTNLACKRCCVRSDKECALHSKVPETKIKKATETATVEMVVQPLRKARKAVLKNEFKETNVQYYGETVTLFCLRDFIQAKKLSQPLLNDQTRRMRAGGSAISATDAKEPKKKARAEGSLEAKKLAMAALRDGKRRKVAATQ